MGDFEQFVTEQGRALLRTAWLLTGDWAGAEDLVQTTLTKTWDGWRSIQRADDPGAYVRRILINTHLRHNRRRWKGELPTEVLPEEPGRDEMGDSDVRHSLRVALAALPARQRAVVVLRHYSDLTEAQTADALGCSIGTVKSQNARAMATLRSHQALTGLLTTEATS
ncbi:SigE family RNA polymerase sigma factor [Kribbella sp. NBC_01245]|uniref:SigE family RNA polymerase sigma factor n=1 Tax=Kribbella sp. NBC_01245 TaxID=2903578 RepID=UPI002E285556|nr:SigE family RNA polymerase sigma factor [Kribbella sp. NBC_01245]